MFDEFGCSYGVIDVLFVNVGIVCNGLLVDFDEVVFDEVVWVNFKGVWFVFKYVVLLLWVGVVVVVNILVVICLGILGGGVYVVFKVVLCLFVCMVVVEWLVCGVWVNVISFGFIDMFVI